MVRIRLVLALAVVGLLGASGCGTMAPFCDPVVEPKEGVAYLYGRFQRVETPTDPGVNRIGLVLTSADNEREYAFCFGKKRPVFAIAVEPGQYRISKWICTYGFSNEISNEQTISPTGEVCRFLVHAGMAYYLGDYAAWKTTDAMSSLTSNKHSYFLDVPIANYDVTSRDLDEQYPGLSDIPKQSVFGDRRPFDIAHSIQFDQSAVVAPVIVPTR